MKSFWPVYANHIAAMCWKCGGLLMPSTMRESGYGRGHGEYMAQCPVCQHRTFYDLQERDDARPA